MTAASSHPDLADGLPSPRRIVAVVALLAAIVLAVLDGAIANVALPTMSGALRVSPAAAIWIVSAYQLALVVTLLPFAALGESLGYRRVFTAGVATFTLASLLCALAPNLPTLVAARVLQGLGAGATMSLMAALLRFTYPQRLMGRAIGWNAMAVALASATGPTLGAAILHAASWPWLFAVNVPIGVLVLLASRALPNPPGSSRRIDGWSALLNALAFGPLIIGVDRLTAAPLEAAALFGVAAASLTLLIRREAPRPAPLIPLDLLRQGPIRLSVIASVCAFAAQMLAFVGLPFYLQHGLGRDAFTTGLLMTPWPATVAVAAPLSARLCERYSTATLCAIGGIALALGLGLAAAWPLGDNLAPLVAFNMLSGLGFGFFQTPNNRNMLLSAPKARAGAAGGLQATARLFGQTNGAVITALLFGAVGAAAPRVALGVGAAFALAAGLISTMRRAGGGTPGPGGH
ncbi:MFS transporter [Lichenihabitans sp. Uapishka_5]|uniref:MFS transporter n=1 Tax=Lichenihabitans sp. Uapishka_5 TaxID=3037302 RepID=UPI0029E7D33C|nr:MFS transporter [Lichenihabitans sp. Uapishka_5]MDX7952783.1 MFS transporter [Lichenihabitans sp. Uapishka_5]